MNRYESRRLLDLDPDAVDGAAASAIAEIEAKADYQRALALYRLVIAER